MATVAIGTKFRESLASNIAKLRIKDTQQQLGTFDTRITGDVHIKKWIIERLWGEYAHLHDQIPAEWASTSDAIQMNIIDPEVSGITSMHLLFPDHIKIPPRMGTWDVNSRMKITREVLEIMAAQYGPMNDMLKVHDKVRATVALTKKWAETQKSVIDFFNSFPSVNAALKHTPAMQLFVPADVLEKVNSKSTRSKSEVEAPAIDAEALAAQVVGIHLRTATGV